MGSGSVLIFSSTAVQGPLMNGLDSAPHAQTEFVWENVGLYEAHRHALSSPFMLGACVPTRLFFFFIGQPCYAWLYNINLHHATYISSFFNFVLCHNHTTSMGFFDEAIKKLDDLSQEVGKHAINAAAEVNKHVPPSTFQSLENFGEEAGKHVGATADDVWKALLGAGNEIGKYAGPTAEEVWKKLDVLGQEAGKHIGGVVDDAKKFEWDAAADMKSWIKKNPGHTAADFKSWIEAHPKQAAGILAGILAPPLAIAAVPVMLGGLGFTAGGVAAGMCTLYA
jgi:hypothetical protein